MVNRLVLSLFPGLGLLDRAFEAEGFTIVRGPDVIWGGDVRAFHPPAGVFDGLIGGDPCQSHSLLANLVRAKGLEPRFPDLTPEFQRVIDEAQPQWFLRENVPRAPDIEPAGYGVNSFLLDNAWLGEAQMRKRRFWFGVRGHAAPNLRKWIPGAALELAETSRTVSQEGGVAWYDNLHRVKRPAICADARAVPVNLGGSGKVKRSAVTGRHPGEIGLTGGHRGSPARYTLAEMCELHGLPRDYLDHCPLTETGKRKAIGNGVPVAMGRALAQAITLALAEIEPAPVAEARTW